MNVANLDNADLTNANLAHADLSAAQAPRADLTKANLNGAYLSGANLAKAVLAGAQLGGTNFSNADLIGADLTGADLTGAILNGTRLAGVTLTKAKLKWTTINDVDLSGVSGLDEVVHMGPSSLGVDTLLKSRGKIPKAFLDGCGVPDSILEYIPSFLESLGCSYSHLLQNHTTWPS